MSQTEGNDKITSRNSYIDIEFSVLSSFRTGLSVSFIAKMFFQSIGKIAHNQVLSKAAAGCLVWCMVHLPVIAIVIQRFVSCTGTGSQDKGLIVSCR